MAQVDQQIAESRANVERLARIVQVAIAGDIAGARTQMRRVVAPPAVNPREFPPEG